ncbi:GroES-like protein [Wallemia mellicola]|nr:GroES-like protein [Wallemia mellicola]
MPAAGEKFYAYKGIGGKVVKSESTLGELKPDQVLIRITHGGLCFSDTHFMDSSFVLGHEPVGVLEAIGSEVKGFQLGDRVGYGCNHLSCDSCDECRSGYDTLCPERVMHGSPEEGHQGGFGKYVAMNARFAHKIPDNMKSEHAAVLQCAGATVFSPFLKYNISPISRVAIAGIGGLGHVALQVARAWGCHVTALSSSNRKRDEALAFGAHEFKNVTEEGWDKEKYDFIISTNNAQPQYDSYVNALAPRGTIVVLAVDFGRLEAPYAPLLLNESKIGGSLVATRYEHAKMLEFMGRHNITPTVEVLKLSEENLQLAFDRLKKGDVKYRFVLTH